MSSIRTAILTTAVLALATLTGCHNCHVWPSTLAVDKAGNGVLEPGETVDVVPGWYYLSLSSSYGCAINNPCPPTVTESFQASNFDGPAGAVYTILDGAANYTIPLQTVSTCESTGDCYKVHVSAPQIRPLAHWDAMLTENLTTNRPDLTWLRPLSASSLEDPLTCPVQISAPKTWAIHIGNSFGDVPTSHPFYAFVEALFHHSITAGCTATTYCPDASIRRDQMSVFMLKTMGGPAYTPPPCVGKFSDVPCPGPFTNWVEDVSNQGVIEGCSADAFCPSLPVTRADMALFLLKARYGSGYVPPPAVGIFADVPKLSSKAPWIEDLYNRGITAGCSSNPLMYCPNASNTRGQMAAFIDKTFQLLVYGP